MDDNPLLAADGLPRFSAIRAERAEPAVRTRIGEARDLAETLLSSTDAPTWDGLVVPLDEADERIELALGPVSHLAHVLHDDGLREAYRRVQPLVTEHGARRAQDDRLRRAFTAIRERADVDGLSAERRKILDDELTDFRLAGAHLPAAERDRCREINVELSRLAVEFAQHVTDATDEFRLLLEREEDVAGLPESLLATAREQALRDDAAAPAKRWAFTLHAPSLTPFLTYQRDRALRETMYRASVVRATSGARDNGPLIRRTLALRSELAHLLGFRNYAEMALVRRMAKTPEEVHAFLVDLAERARPQAVAERDALAAFAQARDGVAPLERHDVLYYREMLRRERYDFSDETVRRHFPIDRVLSGLAEVVHRLYGVKVTDRTGAAGLDTWHPDVRALEFAETDGRVLGHVFTDFYARQGKQAGAWVGGVLGRKRRRDGSVRTPAAYLVCNFTAPTAGAPSLLRHEEVRTLFHEFGHALHHVLSRNENRQCSGTRRVPRDGVELPSQFFENWIWNREPLAAMSGHVDDGAPLPSALLDKLLSARNFLKAVDIIRQMEFAVADLEIHMTDEPLDEEGAHAVFESVRRRVGVFPPAPYDRFENGFLHIFAGGYAAGYYGYAWADVLAADAFSRFEEEGIWSARAASDFREKLLAKGGGADFMQLYVDFRGRRPTPDALLRSCGLA